eukprot:scaffold8558_cov23-Tisochrysis_lutea.AAC.1
MRAVDAAVDARHRRLAACRMGHHTGPVAKPYVRAPALNGTDDFSVHRVDGALVVAAVGRALRDEHRCDWSTHPSAWRARQRAASRKTRGVDAPAPLASPAGQACARGVRRPRIAWPACQAGA